MRLIYFFLFFTSIAFSQNNDLQTAYELYQNSEYNKAINIYKKKVNNSNLKKYYMNESVQHIRKSAILEGIAKAA